VIGLGRGSGQSLKITFFISAVRPCLRNIVRQGDRVHRRRDCPTCGQAVFRWRSSAREHRENGSVATVRASWAMPAEIPATEHPSGLM
jgi:hypothetical protein